MTRADADVVFVKALAPGLVALTFNGDRAIWAAVTLRKPTTCVVSGDRLAAGTRAFRPIGNQNYRSARIGVVGLFGLGLAADGGG